MVPKHLPAGVYTFDTPHAFFEAMFGPSQHDAHVLAFRRHRFRIEKNEWLDRADARVEAETARIIAKIRARRVSAMLEAAE